MKPDKGLKGAMLATLKKTPKIEESEAAFLTEIEKEEKRTFSFPKDILEKIELEAFWERKTQKDVIIEILDKHFKDRTYQPFPEGYKKIKRGKPRK